METEICSTLWTSIANELTSFIAKVRLFAFGTVLMYSELASLCKFQLILYSPQTSQVNNGTSMEPNFDPLRQILKFPFLHLLDNGERVSPCNLPITALCDHVIVICRVM